jgi:hypothetical protein
MLEQADTDPGERMVNGLPDTTTKRLFSDEVELRKRNSLFCLEGRIAGETGALGKFQQMLLDIPRS